MFIDAHNFRDLTPGRAQPQTESRAPTGRRVEWTEREENIVRKYASTMHVKNLAARVNRSVGAVKTWARANGIKLLDSRFSTTREIL